jgi:hypothetical protein
VLSALVCLIASILPQDPSAQRPALREPQKLLTRVAVIGASVADGKGLETEVGARTAFAELVHASLRSAHENPIDLAAPRAWIQFDSNLRQWTAGAVARKATLVIAPDVLWWAAIAPAAEREGRISRSLSALERIDVPLLLGDLPDMAHLATALKTDFSLSVGQLPTPEELLALRQRLEGWSKPRGNVVLVPLARWHAAALAGQRIELRGNAFAAEESRRLVQTDRFHPSLDGSLLFLVSAWDELAKAWPGAPLDGVDWSIASTRQRLMEQKSADRAEESARRRRLEDSGRTPPAPAPEPLPPDKQPHRRARGGGEGGGDGGGGEKGGRGGG